MKVIITGATGMVGEGVLLECLAHPEIDKILLVSRKHYENPDPRVEEALVSDFFDLEGIKDRLAGYDACFFCAGVSSVGMNETDYTRVTYELTLHFARTLSAINPGMTFCYVSGAMTDSSEKGRLMWARVKGRTENDLMRLPFSRVFNFRPGFMKPVNGQKNIKGFYKIIRVISPLMKILMPGQMLTLNQVGLAMINAHKDGYPEQILEIKDIRALAKSNFERMIQLADDVFSYRTDPDQLSVDEKAREKLHRLHPATLSEYDDGNGPVAWLLVIPTTIDLMERFLRKEISEKELFDQTPLGVKYEALYLCSALVLKEYQRKGIAQKLALDAIAKIRKDHPIRTLFVWAFTPEGDKAADKLAGLTGMEMRKRE
jgi:GNAT superfamily N-acetyltransferase